MNFLPILFSILASFAIVALLMPLWIRKANRIGLTWRDMNKWRSEKVAGSGGIIVVLAFVAGILAFIAYRVFYLKTTDYLIELLSLLAAILILAGIGFIDDLLGWQHGGLSAKSRIILVLCAAIPLMAINAGKSTISLPFTGAFDVGILYPLILIPLGIVGAATTFNFLAGFNGLEAGQGILLLGSLAIVAWFTGNSWLAIVAFCMIAALCAFLLFNLYPAKVFPGDVLTYPVGGLIAILSILGNFEKIALFFFIPAILEVFLKVRGRLVKASFGKPRKDGSLDIPYKKLYGLEHVAILVLKKLKLPATEKNVVYTIWLFQAIFIFIGFIIFRNGVF